MLCGVGGRHSGSTEAIQEEPGENLHLGSKPLASLTSLSYGDFWSRKSLER